MHPRPIIICDPSINEGRLTFAATKTPVEDVYNQLQQGKKPRELAQKIGLPLEDIHLLMEACGLPLSAKAKKALHQASARFGPETDKVEALLDAISKLTVEEATQVASLWKAFDKTDLKQARLRLHQLSLDAGRVRICAEARDAAWVAARSAHFPSWWHGEPLANIAEALAMSDLIERNDWHLLTGLTHYPLFANDVETTLYDSIQSDYQSLLI